MFIFNHIWQQFFCLLFENIRESGISGAERSKVIFLPGTNKNNESSDSHLNEFYRAQLLKEHTSQPIITLAGIHLYKKQGEDKKYF